MSGKFLGWDVFFSENGSNMTVADAAMQAGVSYSAAKSAFQKRGLTPKKQSNMSVSDKILDMKSSDAIEYLLGVTEKLEQALEGAEGQELPLPGFTGLECRLIRALLSNPNVALSKSQIFDAMYFDYVGDEPEIKIVDVLVCKIRPRQDQVGIKIITHWGFGYSAELVGSQ